MIYARNEGNKSFILCELSEMKLDSGATNVALVSVEYNRVLKCAIFVFPIFRISGVKRKNTSLWDFLPACFAGDMQGNYSCNQGSVCEFAAARHVMFIIICSVLLHSAWGMNNYAFLNYTSPHQVHTWTINFLRLLFLPTFTWWAAFSEVKL